jgi:hypothetical protein
MFACASWAGTSRHTSLRVTGSLPYNCSPYRISCCCLAYTRPCPVHSGEARVNSALSILRIYAWVRTVSWLWGLNCPLRCGRILTLHAVTENREYDYEDACMMHLYKTYVILHQVMWLLDVTQFSVRRIINGTTALYRDLEDHGSYLYMRPSVLKRPSDEHKQKTDRPESIHRALYKVVQIWPGLLVCKQVTVCPGHIWTTLYNNFCSLHSVIKQTSLSRPPRGNKAYDEKHLSVRSVSSQKF